jgi:DNA-binding SARP family transcriptional activator
MSLEFRILGPLEVANGVETLPLGGGRQRSLLALLLLNANQVVSSDRLTEEVWGGRPPASADHALQVYISQLRKALGDGGTAILTRPPGYLVQVRGDQLDLHRFERLVGEADAAGPAEAVALLREALGLWRGSPLADVADESFATQAVQRLDELRVVALEKRIEAELALGRHAGLVAELQSLAAEHPFRERLHEQLMLALYRCGRQADALGVYQNARRVLVDELGIEPSPALRDLEQAILRQDDALDLRQDATPDMRGVASLTRSLLVVALDGSDLAGLLAVAAPLARRAGHELVSRG